jgi:hypothetical protein
MAAALHGLDAIMFTGGIGENSAVIRERVCRDAAWLGVELDAGANASVGPRIQHGLEPRVGMGDTDQRGGADRTSHLPPCRRAVKGDSPLGAESAYLGLL